MSSVLRKYLCNRVNVGKIGKHILRFSVLGAILTAGYKGTYGTVFMNLKGEPYQLLDSKNDNIIDPDPFSRNKYLPSQLYMGFRAMHTVAVICAILLEYRREYSNSQLDFAEIEEREWLAENDYTYEMFGVEDPRDRDPSDRRTFRNLVNKTPRRQQQESEVHSRCATRLLNLASLSGGVFIKMCQHLANMGHGIPKEYVAILSRMQDRAPPLEFEKILASIASSFHVPYDANRSGTVDGLKLSHVDDQGTVHGPLSQYYSHISREPLACASIAQVHRATAADGEDVVVKVQYSFLKEIVDIDIQTVKFCVRLAEAVYSDLALSPLMIEFESNLKDELDFVHEGQAAERISSLIHSNLANTVGMGVVGMGVVKVPRTRWDLTSRNVLTTEFSEGIPINHTPRLAGMLLPPHDVASTFVSLFTDMVFKYNYVHCDPHPGNALVENSSRSVLYHHSHTPSLSSLNSSSNSSSDYPSISPELAPFAILPPTPPLPHAIEIVETIMSRSPQADNSTGSISKGSISNTLLTSALVVSLFPIKLSLAALGLGLNTLYSASNVFNLAYDTGASCLGVFSSDSNGDKPELHDPRKSHRHNNKYTNTHIHTQVAERDGVIHTRTVVLPSTRATTFSTSTLPPSHHISLKPNSQTYEISESWTLYFSSLFQYLCYPLLSPNSFQSPLSFHSLFSLPPTPSSPTPPSLHDPHAVVLLDHGLYREFHPHFKHVFSRLYAAVFTRDDEALKQYAEQIGMGKYWFVFPLILASRIPGSSRSSISGGFSKEDIMRFNKEFRKDVSNIQDLLSTVPTDFAFIMKTFNLLRSISAQLQFPRYKRLQIMFQGVNSGLNQAVLPPASGDDSPWARVVVSAPFCNHEGNSSNGMCVQKHMSSFNAISLVLQSGGKLIDSLVKRQSDDSKGDSELNEIGNYSLSQMLNMDSHSSDSNSSSPHTFNPNFKYDNGGLSLTLTEPFNFTDDSGYVGQCVRDLSDFDNINSVRSSHGSHHDYVYQQIGSTVYRQSIHSPSPPLPLNLLASDDFSQTDIYSHSGAIRLDLRTTPPHSSSVFSSLLNLVSNVGFDLYERFVADTVGDVAIG